MSKTLLLICISMSVLLGGSAAASVSDRRDHDQRVQVRGVITAIDYAHQQLVLTTVRGDQRIRILVQANDRTIIVENDDHHTRLHFRDLVVGDHIGVGGTLRDHILLARFIIRA